MVTTQFTPLAGDADSLEQVAVRYQSVADAILDTASKLDALSGQDSVGMAVKQLREQAHSVAHDIRKVHPRYHETALALVEFAISLKDAQTKANSAASVAHNENGQIASLKHSKHIHEDERLNALSRGADTAQVERITREIQQLDGQIQQAHTDVRYAEIKYHDAESEREHAIQTAIHRIVPVLSELADRPKDYGRAFVEALEDFGKAVAEWIDKVLKPILQTIVDIIVALVKVLVVLALVLLVIAILIALIGPGLIAVVLTLLATVATLIAAYVAYVIIKEATTPTPTMVRVPAPAHKNDPGVASADPEARKPYENELLLDSDLDDAGGRDSTFVEVIKVVGDDGVTRWRVILPSTQDWEWATGFFNPNDHDMSDRGAVNDTGSNIVLMAAPDVQAAYERAVRSAMLQAGVQPNDPVMITGWSQGGILAGKLAADSGDQFNVQAIFVAGSPIDHMNIPSSVAVISIQHNGDVVPTLDLTGPRNSANWVTIAEDPPAGQPAHGAQSYSETAARYVDGPGSDPRVVNIRDQQSKFFGTNEEVFVYQGKEQG